MADGKELAMELLTNRHVCVLEMRLPDPRNAGLGLATLVIMRFLKPDRGDPSQFFPLSTIKYLRCYCIIFI